MGDDVRASGRKKRLMGKEKEGEWEEKRSVEGERREGMRSGSR